MRCSDDRPGHAAFDPWLALAAIAGAGSLVAWFLPATALDWQPALAFAEPWRWVTAAWVHWSPLHLGANLAGTVVVAVFGRAAELPPRATLAWALVWPATQGALLAQPALAHYGGLSGVLHAGVAVAAVHLLFRAGRARWIGGAVLAGLALKIVLERPWAGPLAHPAGWDIAVAPLAHAAGAVAGLTAGAVSAWTMCRR
jgi:rhomboid family GlyGly-CTERM serine protease